MNFKARKLNHELAQKRPDVEFEESIYSDIIPNHLIKFEIRDKKNKSKFYGVIIHQISNNKLKRSIISDSVIINSDEKNVVFDCCKLILCAIHAGPFRQPLIHPPSCHDEYAFYEVII